MTLAQADVDITPGAEQAAAEVAASLADLGHAIFALMRPGSLDDIRGLETPETQPAPATSAAKQPVADQPRPIGQQPEPAGDHPRPVADQPQPVADQPQPVVDQPQPVSDQVRPQAADTVTEAVPTSVPAPATVPQPTAVPQPATVRHSATEQEPGTEPKSTAGSAPEVAPAYRAPARSTLSMLNEIGFLDD